MRDSEFIRVKNVPMTKEEVRAVSLSYLDINNKKKQRLTQNCTKREINTLKIVHNHQPKLTSKIKFKIQI